MCSVYLVPLGGGRFELYSEPRDDTAPADHHPRGFFRSRMHRVQERWREAVDTARRRDTAHGRLAEWRDWAVCRIAEMIAEQRTLWALRHHSSAVMLFPSHMSETDATAARDRGLARARRHHGVWLLVDGALFLVSGLLVLVPGPNVIAYYFGVRALGHFLSWRGARRALDRIEWQTRPEPALAELAELVHVAREARADRVAAIAGRLKLPRLAAFFDRAAVPAP
jgi:hypothetical protein